MATAPQDKTTDCSKPIAIIPARGGSKRIPRKNIRPFCGKPMMAWVIEEAQESLLFERIIVSTDDEEIAHVASSCGAEVPFLRPKELADDYTTSPQVVTHALQCLSQLGPLPPFVCCLYATAVFIRYEYLKQGYELITQTNCTSVIPVTTFPFPIQRAFRMSDNGAISYLYPRYENTRSQDLEPMYYDAGQFYWLNTHTFMQTGRDISDDTRAIVLPRYLVHDIDTMEDLKSAELMFTLLSNNPSQS